jgi:hypothetical protein
VAFPVSKYPLHTREYMQPALLILQVQLRRMIRAFHTSFEVVKPVAFTPGSECFHHLPVFIPQLMKDIPAPQ